ncbi:MAG: TetR/AcrR family transcriptional regulator [Candidatus Bipolaricaulia bacterium]
MPDSSDRRTQIRDAALRVFARNGYDNTVVEEVADEAGVAKGTVYTYFDRKEELLGAVFEGFMNEIKARRVEIMESDRPPLDKIRALQQASSDTFGSDDELARVLLDIWGAGMQDPERFGIDFGALYSEYRALLRQLLDEAQERGDVPDDLPAHTPAVLLGAHEGVLLQWVLDPEGVDFSEAAPDVIDVLYQGVRSD